MAVDQIDTDRCAVPFPLTYCLICRASLPVCISRVNDVYIQKIDCLVCQRMKGEIFGQPNSLLAGGVIDLGDLREVYHPSFLLHRVKVEVHYFENIELWTQISDRGQG